MLLDLCESNNDCQNDYVCQASSSQNHRICKPYEGREMEDPKTNQESNSSPDRVDMVDGSGNSEDFDGNVVSDELINEELSNTDLIPDKSIPDGEVVKQRNMKSTCKTFFEANGDCAQEGKNKTFSSHMFQRIEESSIDRRMETKILKTAADFLNNFDTDNENSYDDFSTEYWSGGQVIKSVEKQVRVWNWRSSQTDVNLGYISTEDGEYLSAKENHCLSVNFQRTKDLEEFKDIWKASACYEEKKFICELPGTFTE